MSPQRYQYLPVFDARLALVLTQPAERTQWYRSGLAEEVGLTFVTYWDDLPLVPGKRQGWRRLVITAEPPFASPGVVLFDARLSDNDLVIEIRAVAYVELN